MKNGQTELRHYLFSLDTSRFGRPFHVHLYMMCNDDDDARVRHAPRKLIEEAEKRGFKIWLPVVLQTELTKHPEEVAKLRALISTDETVRQHLETATDFHATMWLMAADNKDDAWLMDLH